jgi:hypothetical protein
MKGPDPGGFHFSAALAAKISVRKEFPDLGHEVRAMHVGGGFTRDYKNFMRHKFLNNQ